MAARGALDGVRVIEIAGVVLGPYAGQMLGDLGADVIKVEPLNGDAMRHVGPRGAESGMAPLFLGCNRNKRSLAIDLKQEAGLAAVKALIRDADVLLHNFRPSAMQRLGLDYGQVRDINPSIVYCATFGYSQHGPYGHRGAFDDSVQAASGLAALQAKSSGDVRYMPTIIADKTTALFAAQSILAALFHRQRTGEGQAVDVPMFECLAGWVAVEHLWGQSWEPPRGDAGYTRVLSSDRRPYRTADGLHLSILPYMDGQWRVFCERAGRPELAADERFKSLQRRSRNIDACYEAIAEVIGQRPLAEWLELFDHSGVPVVRVNSVDDLVDDPHLVATGFWEEHRHTSEGSLRMPSPPAEFTVTPASIRRLPPLLGEHSREVLREAGLEEDRVERLISDGVVGQQTAGAE